MQAKLTRQLSHWEEYPALVRCCWRLPVFIVLMQFNCFNHSSVRYAPHYSPVDKCLLARLRPNTLCWRADNHIVLRRPPIQANAQQQETAAVYKPPDLNTASLLLLFFESYKRANGR